MWTEGGICPDLAAADSILGGAAVAHLILEVLIVLPSPMSNMRIDRQNNTGDKHNRKMKSNGTHI